MLLDESCPRRHPVIAVQANIAVEYEGSPHNPELGPDVAWLLNPSKVVVVGLPGSPHATLMQVQLHEKDLAGKTKFVGTEIFTAS